MPHIVRDPFILNGVEFKRGDVLSKSDFKQLEKEQSLFLRFVVLTADDVEPETEVAINQKPKPKASETKKLSESESPNTL